MHEDHLLEKITAPNLPPAILQRIALINVLLEAIGNAPSTVTPVAPVTLQSRTKLILLCAPAGYGKTTLLVDFMKTSQIPCCWLWLDELDSEPLQVIKLLFASIRHRFPDFGSTFDDSVFLNQKHAVVQRENTHNYEYLVDALVEMIKKDIHERFVVALCNYQEVNENAHVSTLMDGILRKLPSHCVVIIESRSVPKLNLASLIVRRQITSFGAKQLRFTVEELCELTKVMGAAPLPYQEAEQLCAAFDGWIAGILLGAHLDNTPFLSSHQHVKSTALTVNIDSHYLYAYLTSDVFKNKPEVYMFLRDLSIVEKMEPDVCNALLSISDAEQQLIRIEQQGLFVTHMQEDNQIVYVCHPILRELLLADLMEQDRERFKRLHFCIAMFYLESSDYPRAIEHALSAHAFSLAADLISKTAKSILHIGYSEILAHWIASLPSDIVEEDLPLLLTGANLHFIRYEMEKVEYFMNKAFELIARDHPENEKISCAIRAEAYITKSSILFQNGYYQQALQMCEQALDMLSIEEQELKAQIYQLRGACACLLGNCVAGIIHLQHALQLRGHNAEGCQISLLHTHLANAYNTIGNYALAEHYRKRSAQNFEKLGDTWGQVHSMIGLSTTKRLKGMIVEAEELLEEALLLARQTKCSSGEAYALLGLGEIYQDQGNYEQSLMFIEDGLQLARSLPDHHLLNNALCALAMTYLFMEDPSSALFVIGEAEVKTTNLKSQDALLSQLTKAIVFFWQQRYHEAEKCLADLQRILETCELKQLHVRVLIYRAACQLEQDQLDEMRKSIERVALLSKQIHYEYLTVIELRRLPRLWQVLQTMPALKSLLNRHLTVSALQQAEELPLQVTLETAKETSPLFQVFALGEPMVLVKGEPITHWRMARSMELFFFLLDAGRPIHKEQLMTALWPEADDHIEQSLRTIVYHLRRVLGTQSIIFRSGAYELNLASLYGESVWYDVASFSELASQAKELLDEGDEEQAEALLQQMVSLYKGDYVQTFYSDWRMRRSDELRNMYLEALQQLAIISWKKDAIEQSLHYWQQMLAIDSCLEEAHTGIIQCYLKQEKRGLALRQYQRCVNILHEELAASPGYDLQKLHESFV